MTTTLLEVRNLEKKFAAKSAWFKPKQYVHAVNGVSSAVGRKRNNWDCW